MLEELVKAQEPKRTKMLNLIKEYGVTVLETDEQAEKLMEIYVSEKMIPKNYKYDGLHIAIESINNLDYILSANFQHINKLKTKNMTESINKQQGYKGITICSPMEVVDND
ncbi:MAG: hypothetical protein FWF46_08160 [Oscillospiraceae bacterium]|nr:hypothetical protein [Oscillospiraceae bacterium]